MPFCCPACKAEFEAKVEGGHRIMCGDSTDAAQVDALMDGGKAAVVVTDPPYGLGDSVTSKNKYAEHDDTAENLDKLIAGFMPVAAGLAPAMVLTPGTRNHRKYPAPTWTMAWFVPAGTGIGPWGFCCWQPILCYGKDPKTAKRKGSFPDAIVHTESAEKNGHPCPKPVNFWKWLIERVSEPGDVVFDPFGGSGTTIVSCEMSGRSARVMEITPVYVDLAVVRWQNFTGGVAVRLGDLKPFEASK